MDPALVRVVAIQQLVVLLPQDLHQFFVHVIWTIGGAVISLRVLHETKEDGIYSHFVYTEEAACNEVRTNNDYLVKKKKNRKFIQFINF